MVPRHPACYSRYANKRQKGEAKGGVSLRPHLLDAWGGKELTAVMRELLRGVGVSPQNLPLVRQHRRFPSAEATLAAVLQIQVAILVLIHFIELLHE